MDYCFVFGVPRSGTTYLHEALTSLRSTEGQSGQFIPVVLCHLAGRGTSEEVHAALAASVKRNIRVYLESGYNSRFRALEDWYRAPLQWRQLHHVLRWGERPLPDWFIYKEPFLSLSPEFVLDAVPDANIVYIYRDGRDVANSLVESYDVLKDQELTHLRSNEMILGRPHDQNRYVPWWVAKGREEKFIKQPPFVRAIWMWKYMVRRCHQYFQSLGAPDQIFRVKYEAFMRTPHAVGDQLLEHLGREDTRAFRRHLDRARTSSIGKHRNRSREEIATAVDIAGEELEMMGYA